ncbi:aldo/keto reductase [bacterium]|nr:aldo/keto reductase [bacterium]
MEYIKALHTQVPVIGFGTWKLQGKKCRDAVLSALDIGYRHLDTAQKYDNEESVGEALHQSDISREEIFLTTKISPPNLRYNDFLDNFKTSLDKLKTDYVDLLLIHWPSLTVPIQETIKAMNKLQSDKSVKYIGVSNFSVTKTQKAMETSKTPLLTNQVHYDPFRTRSSMIEFCVQNHMMLTAYSPLARGKVSKNSLLRKIGDRYNKTAAQVTLRWLIQQRNVCVIPKAGSPEHQKENFDIFDFKLTKEEMEKIFQLQGGIKDKFRSILGI